MANTLKFGNGEWYGKKDTILAYNDENSNYKPLPFDFSRASKATVINKDGLIEEVGNGQPRIDYKDNSEGALLLEPSRTNLIISSNNLTSQWGGYAFSGGNMSVSYGFLSPDGSNNATRLTYTNTSAGTGGALLTQNLNLIANAVYTISFWAKNVSGQKRIRLDLRNSSSAGVSGTYFELTDKWQKYSHTVTNDNATNRGVQIRIIDSEFAGNRVFDMWGVQLEQASYATSTILTQGSAVTRLAESCSQTTPDGVIGQTEGSIFSEFKSLDDVANIMLWMRKSSGGPYGDMIKLECGADNRLRFEVRASNVTSCSFISDVLPTNIYYKVAVAYKQNDFVMYLNGVQISVDTSGNVPTCSEMYVGKYIDGGIRMGVSKDLKLYNTRLSNSELAALTQM